MNLKNIIVKKQYFLKIYLLSTLLSSTLFFQCEKSDKLIADKMNKQETVSNKVRSHSDQTAYFTIHCIDQNTIRVTGLGNIPDITPPINYYYNLSLVGVFKPGMMGQDAGTSISVDWENAEGFINPSSGTYPETASKVGVGSSIGTLATSFGNPDYGLNFTAIPNNPGLRRNEIISGYIDITIQMPSGVDLSDILKDCNTTGDVYWGLPGNDSKKIGEFIISCPLPCCTYD